MRSPAATAKQTAAQLLREARAAGWSRARVVLRPDGSISVDASMNDQNTGDDFLDVDLTMGRK